MKINPSVFGVGKTPRPEHDLPAKAAADSAPAARGDNNTDKISISPAGARQADVDHLTKSVLAEIQRPASPERLDALRTAVQSGAYRVPAGDLADALMRRWMGI